MTGSLVSRPSPGSKPIGWLSVATAVATLLLVPACGGGSAGSEGGSAAASAADIDTAAHTHQANGDAHTHGEGTHTHAAADTIAANVSLTPGNAAWSGSATLLSVGDSVRVMLSVAGMDAGARRPVELVAGGCEKPGSVLVDLTPVVAGSSGAGSGQTAFAASRLEGHAHGGLRLLGSDGATAACASVHLSLSEHGHAE